MEGSCELGNEPSGSIKCWDAQLVACQEGLSSMELVITKHLPCFVFTCVYVSLSSSFDHEICVLVSTATL
jgi:hypothetical protein